MNGRRSTRLALVCTALAVSAAFADGAATARPMVDTSAAVKKAKWGANVKVTLSAGIVEIRSNGIPNHARQAEYALPDAGAVVPGASTAYAGADPTKAQHYDFKITTQPAKTTRRTSTSLGAIGVMISGAVLFNPYEGDGTTVAVRSNFSVKDASGRRVAFLDSCNGHPTPMGEYHYHALPTCITARVDQANGPSHLIGVAFDGFPIYGDRAVDGKQVHAADLDRCNGITSSTPEFPQGIYHYVLLNTKDSRSSIRCFAGTASSTRP